MCAWAWDLAELCEFAIGVRSTRTATNPCDFGTRLENTMHIDGLVSIPAVPTITVVSLVIEIMTTRGCHSKLATNIRLPKVPKHTLYTKGRELALDIMGEVYCIEVIIHVAVSKDEKSFQYLCGQHPITFSDSSEQLWYHSLTQTEDACSLALTTLRRYLGWVPARNRDFWTSKLWKLVWKRHKYHRWRRSGW